MVVVTYEGISRVIGLVSHWHLTDRVNHDLVTVLILIDLIRVLHLHLGSSLLHQILFFFVWVHLNVALVFSWCFHHFLFEFGLSADT